MIVSGIFTVGEIKFVQYLSNQQLTNATAAPRRFVIQLRMYPDNKAISQSGRPFLAASAAIDR